MSRAAVVLVLLLPLALSGCLSGSSENEPVATTETAAPEAPAASPTKAPGPEANGTAAAAAPSPAVEVKPAILEWTGHVITSELEFLMHIRPTEDVLWPLQQEGILVDIPDGVSALEVALEWTGPGEFMIMLHSHKAEGSNDYVEHITELDAANPKCIRVPAIDVVPGKWQVMVHSQGADQTDFTLRVLTVGGAATVVEDDRHGHWLQDGGFEVDEHPIEACSLWAPPPTAA
ncbi:MAG: hypothetical protein ACT4PT_01380 [Methanobacteriota archaeon]